MASPQPSRSVGNRVPALGVLVVAGAVVAGCDVELGERVARNPSSFGSIVFREACQRVAYTAELEAGGPVDASGASSAAICRGETMPGPTAPPSLRTLYARRADIVSGVDEALPPSLLGPLDSYLQTVRPLEDDGTLGGVITRSGTLLGSLASDEGLSPALARLGHLSGMRPLSTDGGIVRVALTSSSLDEVLSATLPTLDQGGAGHQDFQALLRAASFSLRHLSRGTGEPTSPERSPALLRDLLLRSDMTLMLGSPLPVALRDPFGRPLLAGVAPPYVLDAATGNGRTDADGHFLDETGKRVPYVPPLPLLGERGTARDPDGRALRSDGKPLYRYGELDGSLLMSLLSYGPDLFDSSVPAEGGPARDMLFGPLPGLALLSGPRVEREQVREGETLRYQGFELSRSPLLDAAHGALQLLRFSPASGGQDAVDLVRGLRSLAGDPQYESVVARTVEALADLSEESKKPEYDTAKIPESSTLYDDLIPIVQRLLTVDDGALAEDVMRALGDRHSVNLGPLAAQLADDRGYFFMRQLWDTGGTMNLPRPCIPDPDQANNGLTPCGVIGDFGNRPDRSRPDSDGTIDWRGGKTDDPAGNRSALQRLLQLIADGNRQSMCSGRNAYTLAGFLAFDEACDLFQIDNVASFFLLSIASPELRARSDTFAKPAASFREAIKNGRACRGLSADPGAAAKCDALLLTIDDGVNGDLTLRGLIGIDGFGRFPNPEAAARALFADLASPLIDGDAMHPPLRSLQRARGLLFNHKKMVDGMGRTTFVVDAADPDARLLRDANGVLRPLVDEYNGVLFALEKGGAPKTLATGQPNPYPNDTLYDAMRPLVDAFAKHGECLARDGAGLCTNGQNAVQILADAFTVLHRHYPSARSQVRGRTLAGSYGSLVVPDGVQSYERLIATGLGGDLFESMADLSPVLLRLSVDGKLGPRRVFPLLLQLARFFFDPKLAPPGGLRYRDGTQTALRNDGTSAGPVTPYYLLADARKAAKRLLAQPENAAAKARLDSELSHLFDLILGVDVIGDSMRQPVWIWLYPQARPLFGMGLSFATERVAAHATDLDGWVGQLEKDLVDIVDSPLYASALDVSNRLGAEPDRTNKIYKLLRQITDGTNPAGRSAIAVAVLDAVQLLLDDADVVPLGRAVGSVLDPERGPVLAGVSLFRRSRELEQATAPKGSSFLLRVLTNLYRSNGESATALSRLVDAAAEVNRVLPAASPDFVDGDYRSVLKSSGQFLSNEERGLTRFLKIVQSRCLPGSTGSSCPGPTP